MNDKNTETVINEKALFEKIASGTEADFAMVFHAYNKKLFPFVHNITRSSIIAEEIIQEVFLRLWVNREEVARMDNPVGWLYRVASNLSLSHLRQLTKQQQGLQQLSAIAQHDEKTVEDALGAKELAKLIEQAIAQLPPKRQEIFRLSRSQGLNHKEIATSLGLSSNTVKDQLVISLKFIKALIYKQTGISLSVLLIIRFFEKKM
ncbi:RNA polymerase sigma factor [Filimonas effusa]|nr:RNA polymerase sigma-70 factor [Filimonas effusa]